MTFRPGIHALVTTHRRSFAGRKVALLTHPAAVDSDGAHSAELLMGARDVRLTGFLGPEHGFFGNAGAGAKG